MSKSFRLNNFKLNKNDFNYYDLIKLKINIYKNLPVFLGSILILNKNQFKRYYKYSNELKELNYKLYLKKLSTLIPTKLLFKKKLFKPKEFKYYNKFYIKYKNLDLIDKSLIKYILKVDIEKVLNKLYNDKFNKNINDNDNDNNNLYKIKNIDYINDGENIFKIFNFDNNIEYNNNNDKIENYFL